MEVLLQVSRGRTHSFTGTSKRIVVHTRLRPRAARKLSDQFTKYNIQHPFYSAVCNKTQSFPPQAGGKVPSLPQASVSQNHPIHHCQTHHNIAPVWCSCSPTEIIPVSLRCLPWHRKVSMVWPPNLFFSFISWHIFIYSYLNSTLRHCSNRNRMDFLCRFFLHCFLCVEQSAWGSCALSVFSLTPAPKANLSLSCHGHMRVSSNKVHLTRTI